MMLKDGKYYFLKNESKIDEIIKIELQVKSKIEQQTKIKKLHPANNKTIVSSEIENNKAINSE